MSAIFQHGEGNLLDARTDALVNAVNTVGVMGKGIALAFKTRFPANTQAYAAACQRGSSLKARVSPTPIFSPTVNW